MEEAVGFVGPTDRVEPVEMALGAVGACLTNSIALNAPRNGIQLEGMEIRVHADIDPSVLFEVKGPEEHTSCMPKITTEVRVKGNITDEQLTSTRQPLLLQVPNLVRVVTNRVAGAAKGASPYCLIVEAALRHGSSDAARPQLRGRSGHGSRPSTIRF